MRSTKRRFGSAGLGALALVAGGFAFGHLTSGHATHAIAQDAAPELSPDMVAMMEAMERIGTPGPAHEVLDRFVGTWEGSFTWSPSPDVPPMQMSGTIERRWILDGRYIQESMTGASAMGPFEGHGILGYDNQMGEYHMTWFDSMNTGSYQEHGLFDEKAQKLRMWAKRIDPVSGHVMRIESEVDISDPDRHVARGWELKHDGSRHQAFEGVFERVDG